MGKEYCTPKTYNLRFFLQITKLWLNCHRKDRLEILHRSSITHQWKRTQSLNACDCNSFLAPAQSVAWPASVVPFLKYKMETVSVDKAPLAYLC